MTQLKARIGGIKGIAVDTGADGTDQHRCRTVENIAGRDNLASGLQRIGDMRPLRVGRSPPDHREDGTHRTVHIQVGRAVQRIHQHQIIGMGIFIDHQQLFLLLGTDGTDEARRAHLRQEYLVRKHIQQLLLLTLYILDSGLAQGAAEDRSSQHSGNFGGGATDTLNHGHHGGAMPSLPGNVVQSWHCVLQCLIIETKQRVPGSW